MNSPTDPPLALPDDAASPSATAPLPPAVIAHVFDRIHLRHRARLLQRLLASVGPLALAVISGGAFAKYAAQARWSRIPVSLDDAALATSSQVYELVRYVEQSNPVIVGQLLESLAGNPLTIAALGASIAALAITRTSNHRKQRCCGAR